MSAHNYAEEPTKSVVRPALARARHMISTICTLGRSGSELDMIRSGSTLRGQNAWRR